MRPRAILALFLALASRGVSQTVYAKDVAFALDALEKECGALLKQKAVDWAKARKEFGASAKGVRSDVDHLVLLTRMLARLKDGHAAVEPREKTKDVAWADEAWRDRTGCGMFWCKSGGKLYVKSAWNAAKSAGVTPGMEITTVDGKPAQAWLDARIAAQRDVLSFSTDQHAVFYACHGGLAMKPGTRLELELRSPDGKAQKRSVTYSKAAIGAWGPAFPPKDLKGSGDVSWGKTVKGFAYVQVRRCKADLSDRVDEAIAAVGDATGMILDFRANGGGGFDHEAFMGRFLPAGKTLASPTPYKTAGPRQFAGDVVVIVDGGTVSAGETGSGIFKEDGRGYVIGESPTAGMSSQKKTIELPSGLFALHVSVASNKGRFNGGKGIEGIGVIPHEIVAYDPKDLAAEVDTLIKVAEDRLAKFPRERVPYRPK